MEKDCKYENGEEVEGGMEKVIGCGGGVLDSVEEIGKGLGDDGKFGSRISNKVSEVKGIIDKEIWDRSGGDEEVSEKFSELSSSVNGRVSEVRSLVRESGCELLRKGEGEDELIGKNSGNIEGKVELIEGLESNKNSGYVEMKEVLNREIEGRKGEDIGIEGKVDKNREDVSREGNEGIGGDKVVEDNIDGEEGGRIGGDNGVGKGMDKEMEDRKGGDRGVENKFNDMSNGLDEGVEKEEGS